MTKRTTRGTGARLADTAGAPAAKADLKGRTQARAADLVDKAGALTVHLREGVTRVGHQAQGRAVKGGHTAQEQMAKARHRFQERALRTGHAVQERAGHTGHLASEKAAVAGHAVEGRVPQPARLVVRAVVRHPRPVLIAGTAVAAAVAAGVLRRGAAPETR